MLQIKNVSKSFQDNIILNHISWDIQPGHIYGLIGKNGAGKSTLMRCVSGVYEIDHGQVLFNNIDIKDNPNVKRDIVLLSDYPFELKQSNLKQLSEFYQIFYPQFDQTIYRQLVELFSYNETKPLNRSSKGLKRQASLILALSIRPKLLLLDESYDGLDPYIRVDLTSYLREKFIDEEHAIIISSHNVHELEQLCDEMVVLQNNVIHQTEMYNGSQHQFIKVQVGFNYDVKLEAIQSLSPLDIEKEGRVYTLILKNTIDEFKESVKELHPALVYQLDLPVQELFIKKIEVKANEKTI